MMKIMDFGMLLEIDKEVSKFVVKFKAKDITTENDKDCLRSVCGGLAASFSFEVPVLYSEHFNSFLFNSDPEKKYFVELGIVDGEDFVSWGEIS